MSCLQCAAGLHAKTHSSIDVLSMIITVRTLFALMLRPNTLKFCNHQWTNINNPWHCPFAMSDGLGYLDSTSAHRILFGGLQAKVHSQLTSSHSSDELDEIPQLINLHEAVCDVLAPAGNTAASLPDIVQVLTKLCHPDVGQRITADAIVATDWWRRAAAMPFPSCPKAERALLPS